MQATLQELSGNVRSSPQEIEGLSVSVGVSRNVLYPLRVRHLHVWDTRCWSACCACSAVAAMEQWSNGTLLQPLRLVR